MSDCCSEESSALLKLVWPEQMLAWGGWCNLQCCSAPSLAAAELGPTTAAAQKGLLRLLQTISSPQIFQFSDMNTTSHFIPPLILLITVYLLMASSVLFRMII